MAILTNLSPASSFGGLLNTLSTGGLTPVLQIIQDGFGNNSTLSLSTTSLNINTTLGGFFIDSVQLTSTAAQINSVCSANFSAFIGALLLPSGTTVQRPFPGINGYIRNNTDTNKIEAYANGSWQNLTA